MAKLADALDSGSSARKGVEVQLLLSAFWNYDLHIRLKPRFVYLPMFGSATRLRLSKNGTYRICSKAGAFTNAWTIEIIAEVSRCWVRMNVTFTY